MFRFFGGGVECKLVSLGSMSIVVSVGCVLIGMSVEDSTMSWSQLLGGGLFRLLSLIL